MAHGEKQAEAPTPVVSRSRHHRNNDEAATASTAYQSKPPARAADARGPRGLSEPLFRCIRSELQELLVLVSPDAMLLLLTGC
jgi:hypothetical protein